MSDLSSKVLDPNFQRKEAGKSESRDVASALEQRGEGLEVAKSEVGSQKLEVGRLKSDIGRRKLGSRKSEVRSRMSEGKEIRNWKSQVRSRKSQVRRVEMLEVRNRQVGRRKP